MRPLPVLSRPGHRCQGPPDIGSRTSWTKPTYLPFKTPQIAKHLFAYGASEVAAKASRLLVVIAVARSLELSQIGVAAAALAAADIVKSLTENGVNQKIIAAPEAVLPQTCATAHRIFWIWCLGLFALQSAVAFALYATGASF